MTEETTTVRFRTGTTSENNQLILDAGVLFINLEERRIHVHDGVINGGVALAIQRDLDHLSRTTRYTISEVCQESATRVGELQAALVQFTAMLNAIAENSTLLSQAIALEEAIDQSMEGASIERGNTPFSRRIYACEDMINAVYNSIH